MGVARRWKGATALVTGASAGIGAAFARLLAADGCHLVLTARRRDRLEALALELSEAHGVTVDVIDLDLGSAGGPGALFEGVQALGRPLDLLINNAGFGIDGRFAEAKLDGQLQMIRLNVISLVELTRRVLPSMLERRKGDVLLVSSIASYVPVPGFAVYAATKAFVTSFGQALSYELRGTGVRSSVLNPGGTTSEFASVAGMRPTRVTELGMMPAEAVAAIGLRAMAGGKRSVVSGWMNAIMMWLVPRVLPLGLRLRAAAFFQKMAGSQAV